MAEPLVDSIAFSLYYSEWLNEADADHTDDRLSYAWDKWNKIFLLALKEEHCDDCTNVLMTCRRCFVEQYYEMAEAIKKIINGEDSIPKPEKDVESKKAE